MSGFTEKEKEVLIAALNFMLKNEQNALQASAIIVPLAMKVQNIKAEEEQAE